MFKFSKTLWLVVVALAVLAGLLAPPVPAASPRLVVHVNEPFEVNGHVYQSGTLSLQQVRAYTDMYESVCSLSEDEVRENARGVAGSRARQDGDASE